MKANLGLPLKGFLPLALFVNRLERHPESISLFLLLAILTASARFTPPLVRRFGDASTATAFYEKEARNMIGEEMLKPSLPSCQAFYVLSVHQWGIHNGDEESAVGCTYTLPLTASAEHIIQVEVAR